MQTMYYLLVCCKKNLIKNYWSVWLLQNEKKFKHMRTIPRHYACVTFWLSTNCAELLRDWLLKQWWIFKIILNRILSTIYEIRFHTGSFIDTFILWNLHSHCWLFKQPFCMARACEVLSSHCTHQRTASRITSPTDTAPLILLRNILNLKANIWCNTVHF